MISIIICSRQSDISDEIKQNINDTIGVEYELVVIDNSRNNYSIFSAYNRGLVLAKGDVLCFMHEDILFHTKQWGKMILAYFGKYADVGMVGVAGTHFLPNMPAAWWDTEMRSGQLLQGGIDNGVYKIISKDLWDNYKMEPTRVVSVDGLWMCFRKKIFDYVKWDDISFKGFHGYDTDISLQVWKSGFEVHIFWDVLIEHKSCGVSGMDFYNSLDVLYSKWNKILPIIKGVSISESELLARTRIAELRHEVFYLDYNYRRICKSRPYRWGMYIFNPSMALRSIIMHVKRLFYTI